MTRNFSAEESPPSEQNRVFEQILRSHGVVVAAPEDPDVLRLTSDVIDTLHSTAGPFVPDNRAESVVKALKWCAQHGAPSVFDYICGAVNTGHKAPSASAVVKLPFGPVWAAKLLDFALPFVLDGEPEDLVPDQRPSKLQAQQLVAFARESFGEASSLPRQAFEQLSEATVRELVTSWDRCNASPDDLVRAAHWWVMCREGGPRCLVGARLSDIRTALAMMPPNLRAHVAQVGAREAAQRQEAEVRSGVHTPAFRVELMHDCAVRGCGQRNCRHCERTYVRSCDGTTVCWSAQPKKWVLRAGCGAHICVRVAALPERDQSVKLPPLRFQACLVPATAIRKGVTASEAIDLACTLFSNGTEVKPLLQLDHTPAAGTEQSNATQANALPGSDCMYFPPQSIARLTAGGLALKAAQVGSPDQPSGGVRTDKDLRQSSPTAAFATAAALADRDPTDLGAAAAESGQQHPRQSCGESDEALLARATAVVPDLSIAPEGGEATARMHPLLVLAVRAVSSHLRPLDAIVAPAFSNPFPAAVRLDVTRDAPGTEDSATSTTTPDQHRDEDPGQLLVHYASPERKNGLVLNCSSNCLSLSRDGVLGVYDATADRLTRIPAGGWHPYLSVLLSKAQCAWSQPGHPGWAQFGTIAPADDSVYAQFGTIAPADDSVDAQFGTIAQADDYVEALADFARELVRRVGGRLCGTQYVIERGAPVRTGLRCVSCKGVTSFGRPVSVLLFAPGRHFKTHQALVEKQWFEKYMGMVCQIVQATQARDKETGLIVDMPHIVITEPLPAIDEQLGPLPPLRRSMTIDAVARDLAAQLADLHGHRIVHNGVARANVVQLCGNVSIWTFREYCSSAGLGRDVDVAQHIPDVRLAAPELGPALRRGLLVEASAATDIWQLGTLLFELYTGRPYWRQGMSREDVISAMCQPDSLPHELNPTLFDAVQCQGTPLLQQQQLLCRMLSRRPELRPNARALERDFAKLAADQATVQGNTMAPWQEVSETRLG